MLRTTLLLLTLATCLTARVGRQINTSEYRIAITESRELLGIDLPGGGLPISKDIAPSVLVFVFPIDGTPGAKEHRITLRFVGPDGKARRQTLTAIKSGDGLLALFEVEALDVLSVDVERVNPPIIQEAQ